MPFLSVVKIELIKLYHKRTTLLLLLLFLVPALFGIGMAAGLSFFVSDGSDGGVAAVANGLSGMGFTVDMLGQSKYILFLVVIILAAISFSGELENGQMKSAVTRICSRVKILTAKYVALLIVVSMTLLLFVFWSLLLYMSFVIHTSYANGQIFDRRLLSQIGYLLFQWLAVAVMIGFTFLMGANLAAAMTQLSPVQARRLHARYVLKKKFREIAADEGISGSCAAASVTGAITKLQKFFIKNGWMLKEA